MSFITEFMRMGIDNPTVNTEPKKFRYRGELRYPIVNKHDPDVCIKIYDDGRWCHCEASENDVFKLSRDSDGFCLYVWTGKNTGWQDFHPGPVTDYDGPRPYSETPNEQPKRFRYMGELKDMPSYPENPYVKLTDNEVYKASENCVVKYDNGGADGFCLYVWNGKRWTDFHPGPVTDYDGPRPYSETPNDKLIKAIQEKTEILYKKLNIGGKYGLQETNEKRIWPTSRRIFDDGFPTSVEKHDNMVLFHYNLKYIGETDTNIRDNPLGWLIQIEGRTIAPQIGFVVTYKDVEYAYVGQEKGWVAINDHKHQKEEFTMPVRYERIFPKVNIKNVVFNNPATVVFWDDGTKTVVKCENEEYDPEKGLAMAIAKKALGNQGNYYNQIRKWLPEKEDKAVYTESKEYIETVLVGVQELIVDMTFKGATKAELMRAIKHSTDLIDRAKGVDVDIYKSAETYGIVALEEKYQPKSK